MKTQTKISNPSICQHGHLMEAFVHVISIRPFFLPKIGLWSTHEILVHRQQVEGSNKPAQQHQTHIHSKFFFKIPLSSTVHVFYVISFFKKGGVVNVCW